MQLKHIGGSASTSMTSSNLIEETQKQVCLHFEGFYVGHDSVMMRRRELHIAFFSKKKMRNFFME